MGASKFGFGVGEFDLMVTRSTWLVSWYKFCLLIGSYALTNNEDIALVLVHITALIRIGHACSACLLLKPWSVLFEDCHDDECTKMEVLRAVIGIDSKAWTC